MARRVCSRADEVLSDIFKIVGWVARLDDRRRLYFGWCDAAMRDLALLNGGVAPQHESVVLVLIAALGEDESFAGHVRGRQADFLTDDGNWDKLYRAAAATILEEYLDAVDDCNWP
jgi:hypothetical protein